MYCFFFSSVFVYTNVCCCCCCSVSYFFPFSLSFFSLHSPVSRFLIFVLCLLSSSACFRLLFSCPPFSSLHFLFFLFPYPFFLFLCLSGFISSFLSPTFYLHFSFLRPPLSLVFLFLLSQFCLRVFHRPSSAIACLPFFWFSLCHFSSLLTLCLPSSFFFPLCSTFLSSVLREAKVFHFPSFLCLFSPFIPLLLCSLSNCSFSPVCLSDLLFFRVTSLCPPFVWLIYFLLHVSCNLFSFPSLCMYFFSFCICL